MWRGGGGGCERCQRVRVLYLDEVIAHGYTGASAYMLYGSIGEPGRSVAQQVVTCHQDEVGCAMSNDHITRERRSEASVLVFFDSFPARFDRPTISTRFRPVDEGRVDQSIRKGAVKKGVKVGCSSAVFPLEMKSKSRIGARGGRI
jgi:hypothetical protein